MYRVTITSGDGTHVIHEPDADGSVRLTAGKLEEEVSQIPVFAFTLAPFNPFYNALHDRRTIVTLHNTLTGEDEFEGTLLLSRETMGTDGRLHKEATCEGFLAYLCDSIQPYRNYPQGYTQSYVPAFLSSLLSIHNSQMPEEKRIYLGNCDSFGGSTASKTTAYRSTLEEIKENLISRLGGEIRIRKVDGRLYLDYVQEYGVRCTTPVELARNLRSIGIGTDASSIITRLTPLGAQLNNETAERLTIASVNGGKPYIDDEDAMAVYGVIGGKVEFDDVKIPEQLMGKALAYLRENNRVKKSYRATVLDLSTIGKAADSFRAGNRYPFRCSLMGLDEELRIIKRSVDIYKPYCPTVEIGDKAERITDAATRTIRLLEYELPQQKIDILTSAKETASSLIRAGINGYVVANENEICIMDTPDKRTATRVWRWNSGGFGYSKNGYDGTYDLAMTMDGAIVADFITAGVLRGIEIVNGDGTFRVDPDGNVTAASIAINNGGGTFRMAQDGTVYASALNITGGSIHITTSSETYDVIELNSSNFHHRLSPIEWALENAGISCKVRCQAGALWFYSGTGYGTNTPTTTITADRIATEGTISAGGNINAAELYIPGVGYVGSFLQSLDQRVTALGG